MMRSARGNFIVVFYKETRFKDEVNFWHSIHRMQIWRTARSAPGTSRMKARLVRLWCFVLTMLFQKSLASLSIWSLCFVLPPRFCVPECHGNIVESSTAEKVLYFQFPRLPLRGNQRDGGKEFTIAEGTVKAR